jgi:beta-lactamase class A
VRTGSAALVAACLLAVAGCGGGAPDPSPPVAGGVARPTGTASSSADGSPSPSTAAEPAPLPEVEALEGELGVRIGVHAVDTGTGRAVGHRVDERFAHASTFKALLAAVVLDRSTAAELDEVALPVAQDDLVQHSPVAETRVGTTMTLRELCDAAVRVSDNAATNLLLAHVGGPAGLQGALRGLGDTTTRTDRTEPEMSSAVPGDERDTSTPRALSDDLRLLVVDDGLAADDRALLEGWMAASETGTGLVRAGVPAGWQVADRSGTGDFGNRNDVAVVRPPGRAPLVVVVLTSQDEDTDEPSDEAVARATVAAVAALGG